MKEREKERGREGGGGRERHKQPKTELKPENLTNVN